MKFSELNNKRKVAVQELMKVGEVAKTGTITLKELRTWWESYSKGSRQVGYPMWLLNEKEFRAGRGSYLIPLPEEGDALASDVKIKKPKTLKELTVGAKTSTMKVEVPGPISEDDFINECRKAGIEV
ncbi:MAG: hypothetical protein ACYDG4_14660 [Desulfuromonadaceae bacterium]